jgi:hypothetical protein
MKLKDLLKDSQIEALNTVKNETAEGSTIMTRTIVTPKDYMPEFFIVPVITPYPVVKPKQYALSNKWWICPYASQLGATVCPSTRQSKDEDSCVTLQRCTNCRLRMRKEEEWYAFHG